MRPIIRTLRACQIEFKICQWATGNCTRETKNERLRYVCNFSGREFPYDSISTATWECGQQKARCISIIIGIFALRSMYIPSAISLNSLFMSVRRLHQRTIYN